MKVIKFIMDSSTQALMDKPVDEGSERTPIYESMTVLFNLSAHLLHKKEKPGQYIIVFSIIIIIQNYISMFTVWTGH